MQHDTSHSSSHSSGRDWKEYLAPIGVCSYLIGMVLPLNRPVHLMFLTVVSFLMVAVGVKRNHPEKRGLAVPLAFFLWAYGITALMSNDLGRSLRLSVPLVPALLIFLLMIWYFRGTPQLHAVCGALALGALYMACSVLVTIWQMRGNIPAGWQNWIGDTLTPILVVTNDIVFLGVLAPFSLVLLWNKTGRYIQLLAGLSLFTSVVAVMLTQSRVGLLAIVSSLACMLALMRQPKAVAFGTAVFATAVLADGLLGFPMATRFGLIWNASAHQPIDARVPIWSAAWGNFLSSPIWGQGPHTFQYTSVDGISVTWPHNLYLEVLAEGGLLALGTLGYLLIRALAAGWNVQRYALPAARPLGAAALASLGSLCLASLFDLTFMREWVVIVLFFQIAAVSHLATYGEPAPD